MGLSLWFVPSSSQATTLSSLQQHLSSLPGPRTSAPFEPHVTLLSGVGQQADDADSVWDKLQESIKVTRKHDDVVNFTCPIINAVTRGMYFQCVLLQLDIPETLLRLNLDLAKAFDKPQSAPYFPHASLIYGDMTLDQAESHIAQLRESGWVSTGANAHASTCSVGDPKVAKEDRLTHLQLVSIELWDTNGPVQDWKRLRSAKIDSLYA
ncbi:RNA ligase/cyclic nucleotide phosphodiesterase [Ceraceosorus bombacis]|uniref:RNA ligase/cyclic nucleotide phosphodiesterase n=1 Tax=Ceraceosorus bombacis TaxID=401625 RepID=A0A0P1BB25_9BASI|nr:RNA ligase/cyclic nucleotide phosphodiesterase [Ceraceosorus bombacis]